MKTRLIIPSLAALLCLPLALQAADKAKKKDAFTAADANGDGKLSPGEYAAAAKGKMDAAAAQVRFAELDKNKDGALDRGEYNAGSSRKKGGPKKMDGN